MPKFLIKFRGTLAPDEQEIEIEADGVDETEEEKHYRFWKGTGTNNTAVALIPTEMVRSVVTVEE